MQRVLLIFIYLLFFSTTIYGQKYKLYKTLIGHTTNSYLNFTPDSKHLISGSWDSSIKIWDILNGQCIKTLIEHVGKVTSVCSSTFGNRFVSTSTDNTIKIWDSESNEVLETIYNSSNSSYQTVFNDKIIATVCDDSIINFFDAENGKCIKKLKGGSISKFSNDGKFIAIDSWINPKDKSFSINGEIYYLLPDLRKNKIKIYDVENWECIGTINGINIELHSFSPNGKFILTTAHYENGTRVKIWDIENGKCVKILKSPRIFSQGLGSGEGVCYSPNGKQIAHFFDKIIRIIDISTGKCIYTLKGHTDEVYDICYSPDGKYLASSSSDGAIKIWAVGDDNLKPKLPAQLEASQLVFKDNNNNFIDANEKTKISFQLKNTGKGSAYGIVVSLNTEQVVKGLIFKKEYKIDVLAPNEEKQIVMPITSDFNTENAKVKFIIKTKEANGFDAPDEIIHVETAKFLNPLVTVADYNFSSEKGGIAKLGEVINLNFAVQNKGQGEAKNVKIVCALPASNVFAAAETEFTIPLLKPNESKVINFDFFPNRIYKQSNIPITIDITESYGKYGESKTYTVQLNTELKQQNEIIVQGTKQESIEIKSVSLLSDIDKNLPSSNNNNTNAIAVIIGNSNYSNTKSVAYAISDAQSMKNYLINVLGFKEGNILFKENATLGDFNTLFGTKENQKGRLANTIKENISDVFIFYAGHGAPGLKDNKGYFVPVECNPNYVENSGYSLDVFYQNLGQLKVKSLTIVLDACFSGANVFDKISPLTIKVIDPVLTMKNAVVIASSTGTEVSTWYDEKQHGMFTYFFLKAIQDKDQSDKNKDGVLTYQELYDYVSDRNEGVPYQAARIHGIEQHPTITGDMKEKAFIKY